MIKNKTRQLLLCVALGLVILIAAPVSNAKVTRRPSSEIDAIRTFVSTSLENMMAGDEYPDRIQAPWSRYPGLDFLDSIFVATKFEILSIRFVGDGSPGEQPYQVNVRFTTTEGIAMDPYAVTICSVPGKNRNETLMIGVQDGRIFWTGRMDHPYVYKNQVRSFLTDKLAAKYDKPLPSCDAK